MVKSIKLILIVLLFHYTTAEWCMKLSISNLMGLGTYNPTDIGTDKTVCSDECFNLGIQYSVIWKGAYCFCAKDISTGLNVSDVSGNCTSSDLFYVDSAVSASIIAIFDIQTTTTKIASSNNSIAMTPNIYYNEYPLIQLAYKYSYQDRIDIWEYSSNLTPIKRTFLTPGIYQIRSQAIKPTNKAKISEVNAEVLIYQSVSNLNLTCQPIALVYVPANCTVTVSSGSFISGSIIVDGTVIENIYLPDIPSERIGSLPSFFSTDFTSGLSLAGIHIVGAPFQYNGLINYVECNTQSSSGTVEIMLLRPNCPQIYCISGAACGVSCPRSITCTSEYCPLSLSCSSNCNNRLLNKENVTTLPLQYIVDQSISMSISKTGYQIFNFNTPWSVKSGYRIAFYSPSIDTIASTAIRTGEIGDFFYSSSSVSVGTTLTGTSFSKKPIVHQFSVVSQPQRNTKFKLTFNTTGIKNVILTLQSVDNIVANSSATILVGLNINDTSFSNIAVTLTNVSYTFVMNPHTGDSLLYYWIFGDNTTLNSTTGIVNHTYTVAGIYNTSVYVYNSLVTKIQYYLITVRDPVKINFFNTTGIYNPNTPANFILLMISGTGFNCTMTRDGFTNITQSSTNLQFSAQWPTDGAYNVRIECFNELSRDSKNLTQIIQTNITGLAFLTNGGVAFEPGPLQFTWLTGSSITFQLFVNNISYNFVINETSKTGIAYNITVPGAGIFIGVIRAVNLITDIILVTNLTFCQRISNVQLIPDKYIVTNGTQIKFFINMTTGSGVQSVLLLSDGSNITISNYTSPDTYWPASFFTFYTFANVGKYNVSVISSNVVNSQQSFAIIYVLTNLGTYTVKSNGLFFKAMDNVSLSLNRTSGSDALLTNLTIIWQNGVTTTIPSSSFQENTTYYFQYSTNGVYNIVFILQNPLGSVNTSIIISIINPVVNLRCSNTPANTWNGNPIQVKTFLDNGDNVVLTFNPGDGGGLLTKNINITALNTQYDFNYTYNTVNNYTSLIWACNQIGCQNCSNYLQIQYKIVQSEFQVTTNGNIEYLKNNLSTTITFTGTNFPTALMATFTFSDGSPPSIIYLSSSMMPFIFLRNITYAGFGNVSVKLENLANSANFTAAYGVFVKFLNFSISLTWGSSRSSGFGANSNIFPLNNPIYFKPSPYTIGTVTGYIFMYTPIKNASAIFQCNATLVNGEFSYTFTIMGDFNISFKAYNPIDQAFSEKTITIGGSIQNTEISTFPITLMPKYFGYLYIKWSVISTESCICVDFANNTKLIYGATSGCFNCSGYLYTNIKPVNNMLAIVVRYAKEGDYVVNVFIYNTYESVFVNRSIAVTFSQCAPPVVFMTYPSYQNPLTPQTEMRSSQIIVSAIVLDLPCQITKNNFKLWSAVKVDTTYFSPIQTYDLRSIPTSNNTQLIIPPRFLTYGLYKLSFSVIMNKNETVYTFQSSNFTYLSIAKSPIVVGLSSGGISLIVNGINQNICFTPLIYSKDPDLDTQNFTNWNWIWTCRQMNETLNINNQVYPKPIGYSFTLPKTGCFGDGPGVVNFTTSPCFHGGNLDINYTYVLSLTGISPDNRTGIAKINIFVVNGIPPNITVQCLRPLMCKINDIGQYAFNEVVFNPSDALLLTATCSINGTICNNGEWSIILFNETTSLWNTLDPEISKTYIKGVSSMQMSLLSTFFSFYIDIQRLQICYSSIGLVTNGKGCIQFYIFPLPRGINCTLDKAIVQQTDTVCVKCVYMPNYQYRMYVNISTDLTTLGFNNSGQFCSIIPYQTVNQTYIVRVSNSNGGFIDVIAGTIMVTQLNQVDLSNILTNVISGNDSTLTVAIAKGDFKDMSQIYLKYVSVLTAHNQVTIRKLFQPLTNNSKESLGGTGYLTKNLGPSTMTIDNLSKSVREKYEIDRDSKSTVINHMTKGLYSMVPGDIQSLHLISSVVNSIGESADCINRNSQWELSTKLKNLADNFKEIQKTAPRDDVLTIATNLLSANYRSDAAANTQIDNGILRDIKYSKDNYLDYDTNLESTGKSYLNVENPLDAAYSLTLETNSNFQSKIASGVGSNSFYTIQTISKVLRDVTVINDAPTDLLTSQMQYYSIKTQISTLSNANFTKGRSQIVLPDICKALNIPSNNCTDPNNPVGMEIIATPNNVRSYAGNPNKNGLPIPMNSDFISLNLYLGNQASEKSVQPSGNQNFIIFISRDPVFAVPDFNFSEPDPKIQPPQTIPGTGTLFTGPLCFEQKLVVYQFTLSGSDQSVHFQIKSNFSTSCTQYLVVGRLGKPPILGASPDGTVDPENFTFWGMIPTNTNYCRPELIPKNEPDPYTFFVDNTLFKQSKISTLASMPDYSKTLNTLYFGVRELTKDEWNTYTPTNRPPVPYTISAQINNTFRVRIFSTGCYFNSNNFQGTWGTSGCVVGPLTTTKVTQCICNHLTSFASGWIVAPNTIDFNYVFSNFDFTKNLTLFVTEIVIALLFIIIFIWARRMDIKDIEKVGVTPLPSNDMNDMYLYEITVDTSIRGNAGTKSNVYFILSGELDETEPRHLVDTKRPILQRGNVDRFLLAVPKSLGILQYIRLWHDNSGKGKKASWYCNYFGVTDLQTKEKFHFLVNNWFAVEENDGQIDRLIAVASVDELLHFEEVFARKMKMNLSEDHLWLSIMARPPESRFTRVERVACCLLLLFLTMLTTCMFYQTEGPSKTNNNILTVGPFALTPKEIWTGLVSNIIAFVPLFIIIELFRRSQLKHGHANKLRQAVENHLQISLESNENKGYHNSTTTLLRNEDVNSRPTTPGFRSTDQINIQMPEYETENPDYEMNKNKKVIRKKLLPWWTRIFVWGFLSFLLVVAIVFTTFYGIQFGDLACKKWISSMFISFFASVLLTQPIKVILLAIFFALICKKSSSFNNVEYINEEEEIMNELGRRNALQQNEEYLHNELYTAPIRPHKLVVQPPPKEELEKAREIRLKELQMFDVFREIVFYIIFFCTLIFVTYSLRDPNAYNLKNQLTNLFIQTANPNWQFTAITREDQFWTWALNVLVPGLRAPIWYNNNPQLFQRGFISNRNNRLIGYAILRQVRTKKDSCKIYDYVKQIAKNCYSGYNIFNQDEGNYGVGWTTPNENETAAQEFSYSSEKSLNGVPYVGRIGLYSGGGYVYQFRSNVSNLFKEISALRDNHWIDFQTRAVFVEFTTYNPNINLFAINTYVVEMPGSGGMWPIYRVEPANLLGLYSGGVKAFEIFCQVLYAIFILITIVKEIRNLMKQKWKYFTQFWNLIEIFIIIGSFAAVAGFVYVTIATNALTDKFSKYGGDVYLNFATVAFWNENLGYLVSFIVFVSTLKFIRVLRFNKRIGMLGAVLSYTSKDLKQFFIIFAIMFLAFVMVFYSLFMDSLYRYHTFLFATEASMQIALGKFAFLELYQKEPIFGPIVFAGYVLFIIFVLLNMFIAILYDGFSVVKADIELQGNDHELVKFILTKFALWTGISETKFGKKFIKTGITDQIYKDIDSRQLSDKIDQFPEKIEQLLNHINRIIQDEKKGYSKKENPFSSILFEKSNSFNKDEDNNTIRSRPVTANSNILKSKEKSQLTPIDK